MSPTKAITQDRRFYYQYHRDYEYDTDKCRDLKRVIEQLIYNGRLKRFTENVKKDHKSEDQDGDKPDKKKAQNEVAGIINMIIKGETSTKRRPKSTHKE